MSHAWFKFPASAAMGLTSEDLLDSPKKDLFRDFYCLIRMKTHRARFSMNRLDFQRM